MMRAHQPYTLYPLKELMIGERLISEISGYGEIWHNSPLLNLLISERESFIKRLKGKMPMGETERSSDNNNYT